MNQWLLGKKVSYTTNYSPELLTPIARKLTRDEIGISLPLPFSGVDIWNAWELSWLNTNGLPVVATGRIEYSADSEFLVESKSFKLYLNSFNQTKFTNIAEVEQQLVDDLSKLINSEVKVTLYTKNHPDQALMTESGICLDHLNINITDYQLRPENLFNSINEQDKDVSEQLYSHLFKSNCMVTGQPDWATIFINYSGASINHSSLLKYLISFRNHQAFHEPCVERVFVDLMTYCNPKSLSVYCRYTRRGGLDINPFRSTSTSELIPSNARVWRQ